MHSNDIITNISHIDDEIPGQNSPYIYQSLRDQLVHCQCKNVICQKSTFLYSLKYSYMCFKLLGLHGCKNSNEMVALNLIYFTIPCLEYCHLSFCNKKKYFYCTELNILVTSQKHNTDNEVQFSCENRICFLSRVNEREQEIERHY